MKKIIAFLKDENGYSTVESALVTSVVSIILFGAFHNAQEYVELYCEFFQQRMGTSPTN